MKQYEALYIDGQLVNIGTSDITLEWKSVMLTNISKIKACHSYTIKLPMTANNRRVFEMAEEAPRDAYVFDNGVQTPIGRRMRAVESRRPDVPWYLGSVPRPDLDRKERLYVQQKPRERAASRSMGLWLSCTATDPKP